MRTPFLETVELTQRQPLSTKFIDMTGWEHDGIHVESFAGWKDKCAVWNVYCDRCGQEWMFWGAILRYWKNKGSNRRPSCKCKEEVKSLHKSREWYVWKLMLKSGDVCERWQFFDNFMVDMGNAPDSARSIGRIDDTKPYCKENCTWARTGRLFTFAGRTMNMTQWAAELGITRERMRQRFRDYTVHDALVYERDRRTNIKPKGFSDMASLRKFDDLIMYVASQPAQGKLLRRGRDFDNAATTTRAKITARATELGVPLTTRINDDQSFWVVSLPKLDHADIDSAFCIPKDELVSQ